MGKTNNEMITRDEGSFLNEWGRGTPLGDEGSSPGEKGRGFPCCHFVAPDRTGG